MAVPVSEISLFFQGLKKTVSIQGIRLLFSSKRLAREGAPPRIVMFPVEGPIDTAKDITSIRTVTRRFAARCWGAAGSGADGVSDFDQVLWVQQQLFRALKEQMPEGPANAGTGSYWLSLSEAWNTEDDSARQGEEVEVLFDVVMSIDPAPQTLGYVESTSISILSTTLAADLAVDDVVATVATTAGFSPYGGLAVIDSEQVRYVGASPTQFLGLARGLNGTTPASHASGATVTAS